jgi:alkyl sulfatase BDS1-like metallo-beta-lactamase superfamily hydrolase
MTRILMVLLLLGAAESYGQTARERLEAHSAEFRKSLVAVTDRVTVAVGYTFANVTMIEGETGVVVVDTGNGIEAAESILAVFRCKTTKPVQAIVYTHSHGDHIGGASVFAGQDRPRIYAREPFGRQPDPEALRDVLGRRTQRQFGFALTPEENINGGISPAIGPTGGNGQGYMPPTDTFSEERIEVEVAGVKMHLVAAPGETSDQLYVWLPESKVLLCGDTFYKSFPNLYAIRGTPYRDPAAWADSLDKMVAEGAEHLIPGHTRPISGVDSVHRALSDYRDAIRHVLARTLRGMNEGLTPDELAHRVALPPHLAASPYLQEFYGSVAWTVRSIYSAQVGWFDGNPTHLFPLSPRDRATRIAALAGGPRALLKNAAKALASQDYQWAMQLADELLELTPEADAPKRIKRAALEGMADRQVNSCARHYYLSAAKEAGETSADKQAP